MKCQRLHVCSVVCLAALVLAAGCSSSPQGRKRSGKTVDTLAKVQAEMEQGIAQVEATVASLQNLISTSEGDLGAAYKDYSKQLGRLDSMARKVASRNQSLRARAKQYFNAWEKENAKMTSDRIRAVSAERRAAAQANFDQVVAQVAEGKEAFTPMMDEFRDIQFYLANDLTPAGVVACKPIAAEAAEDAKKVTAALRVVMTALARIEAELRPAL